MLSVTPPTRLASIIVRFFQSLITCFCQHPPVWEFWLAQAWNVSPSPTTAKCPLLTDTD